MTTNGLAAKLRATRERLVAAGATERRLALFVFVAGLLLIVGRRSPVAAVAAAAWVAVIAWAVLRVLATNVRVPARFRECLPIAALVVITVQYFAPIYLGEEGWLLDQDNPVHIERARLFFQALHEHRWPVWTNLSQGGEPLVDFYGWLGNFVPMIVRGLTFGKLSFERCYQIGVGSLFTFTALTTYALARRFSRRSIAFGIALLPVIGGHYATQLPLAPFWSWHLIWGVWPSLMALLLAVYAATKSIDVARRGRTRDVVLVIVFAAAACLTHAFGMLALALLEGAIALAVLLDRRLRRRWFSFFFAISVGPLVAAFYWIPSSAMLATYGLRFVTRLPPGNESFDVLVGPVSPFGLTAAAIFSLVAIVRGNALVRALATVGLAFVLLDTGSLLAELGILHTDLGKTIQWQRFSFIFMFTALAATAATLEHLARSPRARFEPFRPSGIAGRTLVVVAAVMLLLPTLAHALREGRERLIAGRPDRYLQEPESFDALGRVLAERKKRDPMPFRVHYTPRMNAEHVMTLAVMSGVPIIHTEYGGPIFLKNRLQHATLEEERAWGVRYVVVMRGETRPAPWVLDERVGPYDLLKDPTNPGIVSAPRGVRVDVPVFRDDEVRLRVSGAGPNGADVRLAIAYYPRFRVYRGGTWVDVDQTPALPGSTAMQIALHVRDGETVLRPNKVLASGRVGRAGSLLGLAALLVYLLADRFPERARRLVARVRPKLPKVSIPNVFAGRELQSAAVFTIVAALLAIAWPRRPSERLEVQAPFADRANVQRTHRASPTSPSAPQPPPVTSRCPRSVLTRDWTCPSTDPKTLGRIGAVIAPAALEAPGSPGWPIGVPYSGFRLDDREGGSEIEMTLDGACRKFLRVHVNGSGVQVQLSLEVGGQRHPIPWSSQSTMDLHHDPDGATKLHATFTMPTALLVAFECSDDAEPQPDDRIPQ